MNVSFRADQDFIDYMRETIGLDLSRQWLDSPTWFTVSVSNDAGAVVAGLAAEFWSGFDCKISYGVTDRHAITPKLLHVIFSTLFEKAVRMTAEVDPEDHVAIDRLTRVGFVYEGFKRKGLDGVRDAMIYGMLEEDCKFLSGVRAAPQGQMTRPEGPDGIATQGA